MWNRISLCGRIFFILASLVFITMIGGVVMVWYTYQMEAQLTSIIEKDLKAFQAAEALETSLVNQKGFVSYYFIDGDQQWLKQLGKYRQVFNERLNEAKKFAESKVEKKTVNRIESEYTLYIKNKDRVIAYYKAGERKTGAELHR